MFSPIDKDTSILDEKQQDDSQIVSLITRHQGDIQGYIMSLLYRWSDTQDVLQETNVILWEKRASAPTGSDFLPWARTIAYYQVLTYRKRNQRSRLFFSEELIGELAQVPMELTGPSASRTEALMQCMHCLPEQSQRLLKQRYYSQQSVTEIAEKLGRTAKAVTQSLYRIRKQLLDCIKLRLRRMDGGVG